MLSDGETQQAFDELLIAGLSATGFVEGAAIYGGCLFA